MAPSYARISALSSQASSSCRLPIGTHCFSGLMACAVAAPRGERAKGNGPQHAEQDKIR